MPVSKDGDRVFRTKSAEAEKVYSEVEVASKTISTGVEILVSTAQYESVKFSGRREMTVKGDITDEQEYELHKDLFLDCAADIVAEGHMVFKQWNRVPKSGWPPKLGENLVKPGKDTKMDKVVPEERE